MTAKLNFRSALFLLLPALVLTFGCKDMKLDIQDSKDRLDVLEGTTITTINDQISAINTSISDLKEMDESLDAYIKALEATATDLQKQIDDANAEISKVEAELGEEISALEQSLLNELNTVKETIETELLAINNTLAELKQADEALDKKIADLRTYVDTELASTKDWANATFSTLAQYEQTQTEISGIKASIEQINSGMSALEIRLNGKIATDIQSAIDALRSELSTDYIARIESAVNTMTQAYTTSISSAKDEITLAYTDAIATAIAESETNMQSWVNTVLTQGYYDIATIDGKMSALSARLDETDTDLQKQIAELKTALETSKEELTKAYKSAIKEAIEENNGVINASIAEAVQNLEDKIQARLTIIETNISNIQKQIANISKDITSIYEQIAGITSSLSDLQDVDKELQNLIDNLETELTDLLEEFESLKPVDEPTRQALLKEIEDLKALIQALQAKDADLQNQISALQSYIDAELKETADWAEATFATLEQYSAMQAEISAIKILIDKIKADITEEYTTAIEAAISNSETDMKAWVNTLLAQGYYTISDINGKVSALEALITDGDSNLQKQINEQKTALQQAKTDLTAEYKQYINQAIASGGIIDHAIATQVKKAQDNLQSQIDIINGRLDVLEDRLGKLENDFVNRIQSLKYIPEYSDRKVEMKGLERVVSLDFQVSPSNLAEKIEIAWQKNYGVVHGDLRVVKNPETRSINPSIALNVISVTGKSDGVLSIVLNADNVNGIDDEFLAGISNGVISVRISDGNNDIFSDWIDVSCIDLNVFEDLSPLKDGIYETANCYIVSKPGLYKFKAYRGNSQDLAGALSADELPEGVPVSANVLWESFGTSTYILSEELIDYVRYFDEYIVFRKTNNTETGNALIAATNKDNMPLWSWHIWMTENPVEQEYYNDAGIMMDRNLGATSAIPGDQSAIGLLYQKGRKDPFVPKTNMTSTIIWPELSNKKSVPIREAVVNPVTEYVSFYQPNQWQSSKTIYDPCPAGYRVPDGGDSGIWKTAIGVTSCKYECYDKTNKGANLGGVLGEDSIIWYPSTESIDGSAYCKDYSTGLYWSTHEYGLGIHDTYLSISSHNYTIQSAYTYWSNVRLCAVRCQKE